MSRCWVGEWRGRKRREEGKESHPPSSCPAACRAILGPLHQIHSTRQQKYKKTVATQIRKTVRTQIHLGRLWQIECVGSWLDLVVVAGMSQPRCQHSGYLAVSGPRNTTPHPHTNKHISFDTNTIMIDQEIQTESCIYPTLNSLGFFVQVWMVNENILWPLPPSVSRVKVTPSPTHATHTACSTRPNTNTTRGTAL